MFVADDSNSALFLEVSDLGAVERTPLPIARISLQKAMALFEGEITRDVGGLTSTRLAMSYVCLEHRDFKRALDYATLVLDSSHEPTAGKITTNAMNRQKATARMYASEASCALGDALGAMRYLVGDGKDDAFDRLASELGGVTIETAAASAQGKARLARAQAMVRCSASAASANLGNLSAAKQLAMSAQAMEDAFSASRENSVARRALVYCMLREGNCGAALSVLRSVR